MGADRLTVAERETEAALAALAGSLPSDIADMAPGDAGLLLTPLARVGDALRLGLDVPAGLRRWLERVPDSVLAQAVSVLAEETKSWSLPVARGPQTSDDDPALAFVVRRRDEAESVALAVRRVLFSAGHAAAADPALGGRRAKPDADWPLLDALEAALAAVDAELAKLVSREDVVRLLGSRAAISPHWAASLPAEPEGAAPEGKAPVDTAWPEALLEAVPSDEVVAGYVARGALQRHVEGVAARSERFGRELALLIDTMIETSQEVGLVARRWRKAWKPAGTAPSGAEVIPFPPRRVARWAVSLGIAASFAALATLGGPAMVAYLERDSEPIVASGFDGGPGHDGADAAKDGGGETGGRGPVHFLGKISPKLGISTVRGKRGNPPRPASPRR